MEDEMSNRERDAEERKRPPGDFTSEELEEDTARFLEEVKRRTQRRPVRRKAGPPPPRERD